MTGALFGGGGFVIVILVLFVSIGVPLWAIINAGSRPAGAFTAAGSSKGLWLALIILLTLFTGIVGVIVSGVYLTSIRPRVRAVMP